MIKLKGAAGAILLLGGLLAVAPQGIAHESGRHESGGERGAIVATLSGAASWYGPKFHGRTTASGEAFDMHDLTAAHRTLPFGTLVRVVNESNDRSVIVRINDRGPFHGKRVIDLSRKAAEKIGIMKRGVGKVRIEVLDRI